MKTKHNLRQICRFLFLAAIVLTANLTLSAQSVKKSFSYEITLLGTSNVHDWTMKSSGNNLDAHFTLDPATIAPLVVRLAPVGEGALVSHLGPDELAVWALRHQHPPVGHCLSRDRGTGVLDAVAASG